MTFKVRFTTGWLGIADVEQKVSGDGNPYLVLHATDASTLSNILIRNERWRKTNNTRPLKKATFLIFGSAQIAQVMQFVNCPTNKYDYFLDSHGAYPKRCRLEGYVNFTWGNSFLNATEFFPWQGEYGLAEEEENIPY
jgi:hypothetical protein